MFNKFIFVLFIVIFSTGYATGQPIFVKTLKGEKVKTWVDNARIRDAPGFEGKKLQTLKNGTVLTLTGRVSKIINNIKIRTLSFNEPWYEILIDDQSKPAWIFGGIIYPEINSNIAELKKGMKRLNPDLDYVNFFKSQAGMKSDIKSCDAFIESKCNRSYNSVSEEDDIIYYKGHLRGNFNIQYFWGEDIMNGWTHYSLYVRGISANDLLRSLLIYGSVCNFDRSPLDESKNRIIRHANIFGPEGFKRSGNMKNQYIEGYSMLDYPSGYIINKDTKGNILYFAYTNNYITSDKKYKFGWELSVRQGSYEDIDNMLVQFNCYEPFIA